MATILLSVAIVGLVVVFLALRILLGPGGEFPGTCASNNPYLRNEVGECPGCGKAEEGEIASCEHRDGALRLWLQKVRKAG
jgi:hypothetical protein